MGGAAQQRQQTSTPKQTGVGGSHREQQRCKRLLRFACRVSRESRTSSRRRTSSGLRGTKRVHGGTHTHTHATTGTATPDQNRAEPTRKRQQRAKASGRQRETEEGSMREGKESHTRGRAPLHGSQCKRVSERRKRR